MVEQKLKLTHEAICVSHIAEAVRPLAIYIDRYTCGPSDRSRDERTVPSRWNFWAIKVRKRTHCP